MTAHLRIHRRRVSLTLTALLVVLAGSLALGSASASADTQTFRNSTAIGLPGNGNASSYPSTINAPAMEGVLIGVTVTFHGFSHGSAQSVNALLVAPDGKTSLLMTGSCATNVPVTTFVFSDQALRSMPSQAPCDKVAYRPTDNTLDGFPGFGSAAPGGPYSANMNNFLGSTTAGTWKLFIKGYGGASSGRIAEGWSLTLDTRVPDAILPNPADPAAAQTLTRSVSGLDGVVTDVNVLVRDLFHQNGADLGDAPGGSERGPERADVRLLSGRRALRRLALRRRGRGVSAGRATVPDRHLQARREKRRSRSRAGRP